MRLRLSRLLLSEWFNQNAIEELAMNSHGSSRHDQFPKLYGAGTFWSRQRI
jgi:hypothetical protein